MSIHNKLRITLVALFVFIIGLVGLNFFTFAQIEGDSPAVNASGSLRMRAYQLSWLSARLVSAEGEEEMLIRQTMRAQIEEYDHILAGLAEGSADAGIRPAADPAVAAQLQTVRSLWENYRNQVLSVLGAETAADQYAANRALSDSVTAYVAEVDKLVTAYDQASQAKIAVSKRIELVVIVLSVLIFIGSSYVMIRHILHPLAALTVSFREVAGKEGDLTQQLEAERYDEIGRIVCSFNSFVSDLRQLMQRAQACAAEVSGLSDNLWQASVENSRAVEYNAVAITNVAASANEQNDEIQMLTSSISGICAQMQEIHKLIPAESADRAGLLSSVEAVRACAQVAAAAAQDVAAASKKITGLTEDSAAAIEQETASLDAFAATAEHLKGLAANLDELVGRFKV